jgi:7-cyano-7-deazaguanine reductase
MAPDSEDHADAETPGRRAPSVEGETVENVPVLARTPVETDGLVEIETSDVTAWCPYEGTADYYTVRLAYVPDAYAVELMSLRDYFQTYRDTEIGHEAFAKRVYDHLRTLLDPDWLGLVVEAPPRYGLETTIRHQTGPMPASLRDAAVRASTTDPGD